MASAFDRQAHKRQDHASRRRRPDRIVWPPGRLGRGRRASGLQPLHEPYIRIPLADLSLRLSLSLLPGLQLHIILGHFGCLIIERTGSDVWAFLLSHDILHYYRKNIIVVKQLIYNDISSTKVRLFVRRGMSIKCVGCPPFARGRPAIVTDMEARRPRYLLPNSVISYILERGLYRCVDAPLASRCRCLGHLADVSRPLPHSAPQHRALHRSARDYADDDARAAARHLDARAGRRRQDVLRQRLANDAGHLAPASTVSSGDGDDAKSDRLVAVDADSFVVTYSAPTAPARPPA
jgi:hypothetical protein